MSIKKQRNLLQKGRHNMKRDNEFLKYQKLQARVIGGEKTDELRGDIEDFIVYAIKHDNRALVDALDILKQDLIPSYIFEG